MYKNVTRLLSVTIFLTASAYGINYKLLDSEAESYCSNITSQRPISEELMKETLSLSIVKKGEDVGPEYTVEKFATLYARVAQATSDPAFNRFASLCKSTYEAQGEAEKRTIVHLLLESVTKKFDEYQILLASSMREKEAMLRRRDHPEVTAATLQAFLNMDNPTGPQHLQQLREAKERHLQFARQSITDDVTAQASSPSRSVTSVLASVAALPNLEEEESFDLSDNSISREGAIQVLKFIAENSHRFPKLQTLNLEGNRIVRDADGELREAFKRVLELPQLTQINIRGNAIAHVGWIRAMTEYVGDALIKKISWAH